MNTESRWCSLTIATSGTEVSGALVAPVTSRLLPACRPLVRLPRCDMSTSAPPLPSSLRVLVLGAGGREHALAWKIAASQHVSQVYVAPGNAGTATEAGVENVAINPEDPTAVLTEVAARGIGLVVVGPEAPLVAGVADALRSAGVPTVGPNAAGAHLEGSKAFCKEVMVAAGVPTARYAEVRSAAEINAFVDAFDGEALVVKADGLAAGKGVIVCESNEAARAAALHMLAQRTFGDASDVLVLEERLEGIETSFIVLTDGTRFLSMPTSQDHKRLGDDDTGPNTGGMGAFSPAPFVSDALAAQLEDEVIRPMLAELARREIPYIGFLYAGVMLTARGPVVLEFNCRLGDPETQALLAAIGDDLVVPLWEAAHGALAQTRWTSTRAAAVVVLAAEGYPETPVRGPIIGGFAEAAATGAVVFHAGTRQTDAGIAVNGGRVLGVTAWASTPQEAVQRAYAGVAELSWTGMQYRRDIGRAIR